ncbi:MAG: PAN domain-containing protein [Pyrinomonadaceae bacterium]|nr:PAN domain-containing protein [Pyrinomonadaceae bacterium]
MNMRRLTLLIAAAFVMVIGASQEARAQFKIMQNYGLERGDYKDFDLTRPVWEDCRDACAADATCLAFTYTIPVTGQNARPAHCWLKNVINRGEGRDWCISGIKGCATGSYGVQAPGRVAAGSQFKIQIATQGLNTAGHWVAIFNAGTKHHFGRWYWVRDVSNCEWAVTAPGPGNYEIVYVLQGDDWPIAARAGLAVQ